MFGWRRRNQDPPLDDLSVGLMEPRLLLCADALGVDAATIDAEALYPDRLGPEQHRALVIAARG